MKVSILVATCNRCDKLRSLLDTLKAKGVAGLTETEVIVIDNNSNDATRQVVAEYTSLENPEFRYLLEKRPGKSRALNAGIREARGEILAFTDDDCVPDRGWVENILKEFDSDPELSILGGRVELYDEMDLQQAILLSNDRIFVRTVKEVCQPTIIGANMAFRKTALNIARRVDPLLGPGTACKAAEDIDLLYRCLKKRLRMVYSPKVLVFHNHGRRTKLEDLNTTYAYALGRGGFYFKHMLRSDFQIFRMAFRELYDLAKTLMKGVITRTDFPYHRLIFPGLFCGAFYYCQERFFRKRLSQDTGV